MQKLDTMNHAQRATFARALYVRRAHLPFWAVARIIETKTPPNSKRR